MRVGDGAAAVSTAETTAPRSSNRSSSAGSSSGSSDGGDGGGSRGWRCNASCRAVWPLFTLDRRGKDLTYNTCMPGPSKGRVGGAGGGGAGPRAQAQASLRTGQGPHAQHEEPLLRMTLNDNESRA